MAALEVEVEVNKVVFRPSVAPETGQAIGSSIPVGRVKERRPLGHSGHRRLQAGSAPR